MPEIRTSATAHRSPSDLFAYVTTPGNWPQWHPSSVRVTGTTDHSLQLGESCVEDFVVAGRRGSCTWTAIERVNDRRWTIETEMQGQRATISYTLMPADGGTLFERVMRYRMPNVVLAALDLLVIRLRIQAESEEATRRLKARLEAEPAVSTLA